MVAKIENHEIIIAASMNNKTENRTERFGEDFMKTVEKHRK